MGAVHGFPAGRQPHWPDASHTPVQHWTPSVHDPPVPKHVHPCVEASQLSVQQSALLVQGVASLIQQSPDAEQFKEQHWMSRLHDSPMFRQPQSPVDGTQVPLSRSPHLRTRA